MNQQIASLELFHCVVSDQFHKPHVVGTAISDTPEELDRIVLSFLVTQKLTFNQLNAGFYKDWAYRSDFQRFIDQFFHYLTVAINDMEPGVVNVYLPAGEAVASGNFKVTSIGTLTPKEAIERSVALLNRNAMTQDQIEKCLTIIGDENLFGLTVKNREAQCLIWDRTGELPTDGGSLLRYFVFKATGKTLVISNPASIQTIKTSGYILPKLSQAQMDSIAERFLPNKNLWLAFKHGHRSNIALVNQLRRLANRHHKAIKPSVFSQLTAKPDFTPAQISAIASQKNMSEIAKVINVLRTYAATNSRVYKIRNGKMYWKLDELKDRTQYIPTLTKELAKRAGNITIKQPPHIQYAFPVSKKQYLGNVPMGTKIEIPTGNSELKLGIHWFNQDRRMDLDLRADTIGESVGWNAAYSSTGLRFSGDVTNAPKPNGASEYFAISPDLNNVYVIKVNNYTMQVPFEFKLIIGFGSTGNKNLLDLDEVVFELPVVSNSREFTIGILTCNKYDKSFYLYGGESGMRNVGDAAGIQLAAMYNSIVNALRLSDVFMESENGIDLTNPTIDTFDFCL